MRVPDQFAAKLLDGLRAREREVLGLRYFEQFEVPDIACMLGMNDDSVSGHLSKGVKAMSRILDAEPGDTRRLLEHMGEGLARREPKRVLSIGRGSGKVTVGVLVHRQIMGCAVREDHQSSDVTRYFIVDVDGRAMTTEDAAHWVLDSSAALGLGVRRGLLDAKRIKDAAKFDDESMVYFFPVGFGGAELYFERDFDHAATKLPLPAGRTVFERTPPTPIDIARRAELVPDVWPLQAMDLGRCTSASSEAMSLDAEDGLRSC